MASLHALEEEVEALCAGRAQARADAALGRTRRVDLGAVERAHPSAVSPDTLAAVRAAASSPATLEGQRPRLLALLSFLPRAVVEAQARSADDALLAARAATRVTAAGAECPLEGAWVAVAEEPDTARRAALARATADAELQLLAPVQRRWEAAHRARERLGASAQLSFLDTAALQALEVEAAEFLRSTEDAWRDVLGYALKRLGPELQPLPRGDAGLEDLLRLADTPLLGAFPAEERLPAVRQWLTAAGLGLEASGRVRLFQDAPGLAEASSFAVQLPEQVLLVLPLARQGSFAALLDASGRARAAAAVSDGASLSARRLGDGAVPAAAGALFTGVLRSESWLRRFLGHGRVLAREVARLGALAQLGELRLLAARLAQVRELHASGPSRAGLESLAATVSEALFLTVPAGALLPSLVGMPSEAEALRAAALADCLRRQADEQFDADDFRNPAAARWLEGVWRRGAELDASALAQHLSGTPLALSALSSRLVAALGA